MWTLHASHATDDEINIRVDKIVNTRFTEINKAIDTRVDDRIWKAIRLMLHCSGSSTPTSTAASDFQEPPPSAQWFLYFFFVILVFKYLMLDMDF